MNKQIVEFATVERPSFQRRIVERELLRIAKENDRGKARPGKAGLGKQAAQRQIRCAAT